MKTFDTEFKLRMALARVRYLNELVSKYERFIDLPVSNVLFEGTLEEIERVAINARIKNMNGSKKRAAESLKMSRSALHARLAKWRDGHE